MDTLSPLIAMHLLDRSCVIVGNFFEIPRSPIGCPHAEAIAAFKHSIRDEWLDRQLGQDKPRIMAALTSLMTHFCAGEDS